MKKNFYIICHCYEEINGEKEKKNVRVVSIHITYIHILLMQYMCDSLH